MVAVTSGRSNSICISDALVVAQSRPAFPHPHTPSMSANTSTPISAFPNGVNISSAVDPMFVGIMLCPLFLGIIISQAFTYFNRNNDDWMLRSLVGTLVALDITSTCLTAEMAHVYLIQGFGDLAGLTLLPKSSIVEVMLNVTICTLVELFFARRVYLINQKQMLMPAIITLFAVAGFVAGIFIVVDIAGTPTVAHLATSRMKIEVALTNVFEATSDLLATIALSWAFYSSRGHIRSTNTLLERLLAFTVARGGLVTVAQFLTLILYVTKPTMLNWMPVHFLLGKLSLITMVVILNSRDSLRRQGGQTSLVTDSVLTDVGSQPFRYRSGSKSHGQTTVDSARFVHVQREQVSDWHDDGLRKHTV
ncbi:hypothetical protein C8R43DRAFT_1022167 [Mycena crocata]|nr:hypothetical protein C8R43DRAFT_1022167 [Mycena crocata]